MFPISRFDQLLKYEDCFFGGAAQSIFMDIWMMRRPFVGIPLHCTVRVHGLKAAPQHNGRTGTVLQHKLDEALTTQAKAEAAERVRESGA